MTVGEFSIFIGAVAVVVEWLMHSMDKADHAPGEWARRGDPRGYR